MEQKKRKKTHKFSAGELKKTSMLKYILEH